MSVAKPRAADSHMNRPTRTSVHQPSVGYSISKSQAAIDASACGGQGSRGLRGSRKFSSDDDDSDGWNSPPPATMTVQRPLTSNNGRSAQRPKPMSVGRPKPIVDSSDGDSDVVVVSAPRVLPARRPLPMTVIRTVTQYSSDDEESDGWQSPDSPIPRKPIPASGKIRADPSMTPDRYESAVQHVRRILLLRGERRRLSLPMRKKGKEVEKAMNHLQRVWNLRQDGFSPVRSSPTNPTFDPHMEYKLERAMVHMQYVWRRIRKRRHKVLSPLKKEVPVMARGPQYIKGERIGKGAFGVVYLGMDVVTSEHVAVKEIEVDPANVTTVEQVRKEFEFLRQLRHPHVVGVHGFDVQSDRAVIYMEYMPGGSVLSMLNSFKFRLHEGLIRRYVRQALLGLSYLHENGIVHRDIKPGNLLVTLDGTLKLSDFGTCKRITEKSSTLKHVGTPSYMSPEAIRGKAGPPSDVWALGASIVEMATGASPWSELSLNDPIALLFHIGMAQGDGHHPRIPDHLTKEGKDFLQKCFVLDPSGRPSCEQLLQHSFPTDGDDPAMEDLMEYLSHRRTSTLAVTSALSQRMSMVTFQ